MHYDKMFPHRYLKAEDVPKPRTLTIDSVSMEEVGEDSDERPVIRFEGVEQGLVCNRTNGETLKEAFGADSDDWCGQEVILFKDKTSYAGKSVPCLRLRIPETAAAGDSDDLAP
jgi:hypothetical protein